MNKNSLFVGALNLNGIAFGGALAKNRHLLRFFQGRFPSLRVIDVINLRKRPFIWFRVFLEVFRSDRNCTIIFSTSAPSTCFFVKLLQLLHIRRNIVFWALGGDLIQLLNEGTISLNQLAYFKKIIVQSPSIQVALEKFGIKNVKFVPNVKFIDYMHKKQLNMVSNRFVFISQIRLEKGVDLIFESVRGLMKTRYYTMFTIDIFGTIDPEYEVSFLKQLKEFENINYRGFLDLMNPQNYDVLSRYDVMLFPTFCPSEGFPGIMIDAFIAGLPVIASDWNLNKELISIGKTGWLIPPRDANALAQVMINILDGKFELTIMSANCQNQAYKYSIENVFTDSLLSQLGLEVFERDKVF